MMTSNSYSRSLVLMPLGVMRSIGVSLISISRTLSRFVSLVVFRSPKARAWSRTDGPWAPNFFCYRRILHARRGIFSRTNSAKSLVGNAVGHDVPEGCPAISRTQGSGPQLLVHRAPVPRAEEIQGRAPVEVMEESAGSFFAPFVNLRVGSLESVV